MSTLEIRRHAHRKYSGGSQLSQEGVNEARRLGTRIGPFSYVATSILPRARETAIAMGFAVDQEIMTLLMPDEAYAEMEANKWWQASHPMVALADLMRTRGAVWQYGLSLSALWRDLLTPLPKESSALVIGHTGYLELGLVASFPDADHSKWPKPFAPLEGARLVFEGEPARFTRVSFLESDPLETSK